MRIPVILAVLGAAILSAGGSSAACTPTNALPGSPGCQPVVTSAAPTDTLSVWQPGSYPASLNQIAPGNLPIVANGQTNTLGTWMGYLSGTSNPNPIVLGGGLTLGSTPLILGSGIGDTLGPLINFQGSGHPGLFLSDRLIFQRGTATASDYADFQVNRTTTFTGGSGNINAALRVQTGVGANDATQEWNIVGSCSTAGTAGGYCLGGYFQGVRNSNGTDAIWGGIFDGVDNTGLASSGAGGKGTLGAEVDVEANKADDATNLATWGGFGVRKGLQIVAIQHQLPDATAAEFSNLLWFGEDNNAYADSVIGVSVNFKGRALLDSRGMIAPTGVTNPVATVVAQCGQIVDFDGGPSITSNPGRYLSVDCTSHKLFYYVGATAVFSLDGSGNLKTAGTITASTTP